MPRIRSFLGFPAGGILHLRDGPSIAGIGTVPFSDLIPSASVIGPTSSSFVDGQEAVIQRQGQQRHRRADRRAELAPEAAVGLLGLLELADQELVPLLPGRRGRPGRGPGPGSSGCIRGYGPRRAARAAA